MHREHVQAVDPAVATALEDETDRQRETLAMIASENHASRAVLEAQGSVLTNKYAEGYPGKRYYGGCEHVDEIERLAIDRARELFDASYVNVQPHSGTQANLAAFTALCEPGETLLSMDLSDGGHLSHGHPKSLVGQLYDVRHYGVDPETGRLDYEALERRARDVDPDVLVAGYSAYPREVEWERLRAIADGVDALLLADIAHISGLVAAGVHPSPVGTADVVTASTHKTIRAGRGGIVLADEEYGDAIDSAIIPGTQGGPLLHNVAGKAVGFEEALRPGFADYAEAVVDNARALAGSLRARGCSLVSGGTDTHLVLIDLRESHPELTGREAEAALERTGIVCNKNAVPGDSRQGLNPSGVRLGTPALTTRGFDEDAMETVGECVVRVLDAPNDETVRREVVDEVADLCKRFPLYEGDG